MRRSSKLNKKKIYEGATKKLQDADQEGKLPRVHVYAVSGAWPPAAVSGTAGQPRFASYPLRHLPRFTGFRHKAYGIVSLSTHAVTGSPIRFAGPWTRFFYSDVMYYMCNQVLKVNMSKMDLNSPELKCCTLWFLLAAASEC